MVRSSKEARKRAEALFEKEQKTGWKAELEANADRRDVREKTSRLKSLRLAKEAAENEAETEKKPAAPTSR